MRCFLPWTSPHALPIRAGIKLNLRGRLHFPRGVAFFSFAAELSADRINTADTLRLMQPSKRFFTIQY
jgi:hypothetical protein